MALEKENKCKETLGLGGLTFGYEFCFKLEWFESPGNSSDFSFFFFKLIYGKNKEAKSYQESFNENELLMIILAFRTLEFLFALETVRLQDMITSR